MTKTASRTKYPTVRRPVDKALIQSGLTLPPRIRLTLTLNAGSYDIRRHGQLHDEHNHSGTLTCGSASSARIHCTGTSNQLDRCAATNVQLRIQRHHTYSRRQRPVQFNDFNNYPTDQLNKGTYGLRFGQSRVRPRQARPSRLPPYVGVKDYIRLPKRPDRDGDDQGRRHDGGIRPSRSAVAAPVPLGVRPSIGAHTVTATFTGTNGFGDSTLSSGTVTIGYNTTTTVSGSPNPGPSGQSVTVTATVTSTGGGTPTGSVTFYDAKYLQHDWRRSC